MVKIDKFDWNGWLDEDMHFATNMLLDTGSINPMFILHTRSGELMVVGTSFTSDDEKRASHIYIQMMCLAYDVVGFSFIGEAWVRMMKRDPGESVQKMNERAMSVRPSESADRKEVVAVTLVYRDERINERKVLGKMAEIVRGSEGKPTRVIPISMPAGTASSGDISNILMAKAPNAAHRAAAADMLSKFPNLGEMIKR